MELDEPFGPFAFGVRQAQPARDDPGDAAPDVLVMVERQPPAIAIHRRRLADIVQQRTQREREARRRRRVRAAERSRGRPPGVVEFLQHQHGVVPQIARRLHGLALRHAVHRADLRQDHRQQADSVGQPQPDYAVRIDQQAAQFLGDALGADDRYLAGHFAHGRFSGRVEFELEPRGEPDGAEQPQFVLVEPLARIADRTKHTALDVGPAADEIEQLVAHGVEEHAVDREVATRGIGFGRTELDAVRMPPVRVRAFGAERRHLDLSFVASADDDNHAETRAHGDRAAEQSLHFVGPSAGGDVVVVRRATHHEVAHTAARKQRAVPGLLQAVDYGDGELASRVRHVCPITTCVCP